MMQLEMRFLGAWVRVTVNEPAPHAPLPPPVIEAHGEEMPPPPGPGLAKVVRIDSGRKVA